MTAGTGVVQSYEPPACAPHRRLYFSPKTVGHRGSRTDAYRPPSFMPPSDHRDLSGLDHHGVALSKDALDALLPAVYDELRVLAQRFLRHERPDHTLQPTALVNEAYLRLSQQRRVDWLDRAQFFGIAAQMMRRILVNHAEAKHAAKRGGTATRVTLDDAVSWSGERDLDLVELDEALNRLAAIDARQARLVELRFFAGLTIEDTADLLGVSPATVKRDWTVAKTWLRRELSHA